MTLRRKALLILGATLTVLICILGTASGVILLRGFLGLERQTSVQNASRVLEALGAELTYLDTITTDWAAWDDSYAFIADGSEAYIKSNLRDTTFPENRLSLIAYINKSGRMVFGKVYDEKHRRAVPIPASIRAHLEPGSRLLSHSSVDSVVKGVLSLPEGALLVSSRPIIRSGRLGPARGTLIMGSYLSPQLVTELGQRTHLSLSMHRFDDPALPQELFRNPSSQRDRSIAVRPENPRLVSAYAAVKDIYGQPALTFRVDMPRALYQQGLAGMRNLFLVLGLLGLLAVTLSLLLIERVVLSRLTRITDGVNQVRTTGDLSIRVPQEGHDELSLLADSLNAMLSVLDRSRGLRMSEQRYRSLVDELCASQRQLLDIIEFLPEATFVIGRDGNVIAWNNAMEELTGVSKEEVVNKGNRAYAAALYETAGPCLIDLVGQPEADTASGPWERLEQRGRTLYAEAFLPSLRHGRGARVSVAASPLLDGAGNRIGAIETLRELPEAAPLEALTSGEVAAASDVLAALGDLTLLPAAEPETPAQPQRTLFTAMPAAVSSSRLTLVDDRQLATVLAGRELMAASCPGLDALATVRDSLNRCTQGLPISHDVKLRLALAVSEALLHALQRCDQVDLSVIDNGESLLAILDVPRPGDGAPLSPWATLAPAGESGGQAGLGFELILRCADQVMLSPAGAPLVLEFELYPAGMMPGAPDADFGPEVVER